MKLTVVHERWLISLIALHSAIIGILLMAVPQWLLRFGGWQQGIEPVFYAYQAGIFHVVLAVGYLLEHRRYRGVSFLITAKTMALAFLLVVTAVHEVPWAVPLCGLADGAMALLTWFVHRQVVRPVSL